jgi:hypothetical protein
MVGETNRKTWSVIGVLLPAVFSSSSGGLAGKSRFKAGVFLVVVVCFFCSAAFGQPWLGSGTAEDPYQIWTAADMQAIGVSGYLGADFELMADIDLSAYTGTSFNIIGTEGYPNRFTGVFDGNGHTISNFTYSSTGTNCIGVFGEIRRATIKDLGLINPNVDAGTGLWVGGLVGQVMQGSISNCYAEGGSVSGNYRVGGLVGAISAWPSDITNCYSTANVSGTSQVGGLGGYIGEDCTVTNCYSQGSASGDADVGGLMGKVNPWSEVVNCYSTGSASGTTKVGGLVGYGGPVCASFWDTQTSGLSTSGGGTPKTTAQMQTASTFIGWNGCGSEGVWVLDEGNDYPRLWYQNLPGAPLPTENLSDFVAGAGTEEDPYLIETGEQMNLVGLFWCEWDKQFLLTADIDLSAYTGTSFNIIGTGRFLNYFSGKFDGNDHTISNFSYDSNNTDYIGIFSNLRGSIKDLGVINPNVDGGTGDHVGSLVASGSATGCYVEGGSVSGGSRVGGLVGGGSATNCTSSTSVSGIEDVGGLVGGGSATNCTSTASVSGTTGIGGLVGSSIGFHNYPSRITSCYSAGIVSGVSEVGGLAGRNEAVRYGIAEVTNCYSTASVTGYWYVGGFVGRNEAQAGFSGVASVTNCYSAGGVSGFADVGGLVGYNELGSITDSFWDTETSGQATSDGGVGLPTALMQSAFIFAAAGWDFVGESANGTDDFWDICDGTNYPKLAWQVPVLGDFGCPDGVDWIDVAILCDQWLQVGEYSADIAPPPDGDGIVNFRDFAAQAENWQAGK